MSPPHTSPPPTQQEARNSFGTAGFVLGLVGLIFAPIPLVGVVAWPLVIVGLALSLIGFNRARKRRATNRGLAVAGIVLSVVGLVICILWAVAFGKAADDVEKESNRVVTVQYEVGGDAANVTISYTTFGDGVNTSQETVATLPWTKQVQTAGLAKGGSLTVTAGADGGTVTCKVVVDGREAKTGTAAGAFATASCSDF